MWRGGDHYKWRLMRANGVPEELITGDGDPYEKFLAWARTVEKSVGNPLYAWTHMELKNYFGVEELLSEKSAPAIWEACNAKLREESFSARGLINRYTYRALCTTDDPADTLEHHAALAADGSFPVKVLPAFRPETALHPEQVSFRDWVARLGEVTGRKIAALEDLEEALAQRAAYFQERGCLIADQSLQSPDFTTGTRQEAEAAFVKALAGEVLSPAEQNAYQTPAAPEPRPAVQEDGLCDAAPLWGAAQHQLPDVPPHRAGRRLRLRGGRGQRRLHGRPVRRPGQDGRAAPHGDLLPERLRRRQAGQCAGAFQQGTFPQKMQLGAPWWFSDHKDGMVKMMKALANTGLLSGSSACSPTPGASSPTPATSTSAGALRPVGPVDGGRGDSGR